MTQLWVVAVDGSDSAQRAAEYAESVALKCGGGLLLVHVIDWSQFSFLTPEELAERHKNREEELKNARERILEPLADRLRKNGVPVQVEAVHGNPVKEIHRLAREHRANHIVAGRQGQAQGLLERLFGGVASGLVQTAEVPITLVP